MKRFINVFQATEELRLRYCKDCNNFNGIRCRSCDIDDVLTAIEDFPTADAVEVVFCKDCKRAERIIDQYGNLEYKCRKMNDYMSPADYCSRGERKEK